MNSILCFILCATIFTRVNSNVYVVNNDVNNKEVQGYIYVGDSRFVGMNNSCDIEDETNKYVVAKVGQGYKWLTDTAEDEIDTIIEENNEVTHWNIIMNLGVNDLSNIDKYKDWVEEKSDTLDISYVSVNPVKDYPGLTNDKIEKFNNSIKEIDGIEYIDTYSSLLKDGFSSKDGLHYEKETNKKIYKLINDEVECS